MLFDEGWRYEYAIHAGESVMLSREPELKNMILSKRAAIEVLNQLSLRSLLIEYSLTMQARGMRS